ncbi:MAG: hypothetical protein CMM07_01180 [Rhodopirellula sp.]|nr:hypothetical protein [Rhodopirellula sp.]
MFRVKVSLRRLSPGIRHSGTNFEHQNFDRESVGEEEFSTRNVLDGAPLTINYGWQPSPPFGC